MLYSVNKQCKRSAVLGGFLFVWLLKCQSQQLPQYTQYIFNNYLLNPALSGIENYTELKAGYRQQWAGLEDAPETSYLSLHAPLGKGYKFQNASSFSGRGNHPMSRSFVSSYSAAEPHHGIGIHLMNDEAGLFNMIDLQATYAYHLGLAPKLNLALGAGAGITQINLNKDKFRPENANDPKLSGISGNQFSPLLSIGAWLYSSRWFLGLSANQLLSGTNNQSRTTSPNIQLVPHYYATTGYKVFLAEEIAFLPSVLLTKVQSIYSIDCNVKVAFADKFWIGGSYRRNDAFSAMAGFNISSLFNLSYSYDYTVSPLQQVSNGSHEIVLGLLLNNKYKVICPQNQF